jgi:hypothetical protein
VVNSHGSGRKSAVVTKVTDLSTELVQPGIVGRFDAAPLLVIWEITQACDLACAHCRVSAVPCRKPDELTTEEGFRLLAEVLSFGEPLMIFTGRDPLQRPDVFELLSESVRLGLRTTITPSATPLLFPWTARMRSATVVFAVCMGRFIGPWQR